MMISSLRAFKIATVAAAVTFGCLWLSGILFYHLDPLGTIPAALWFAGFIFAGMFFGLLLAYGSKADD